MLVPWRQQLHGLVRLPWSATAPVVCGLRPLPKRCRAQAAASSQQEQPTAGVLGQQQPMQYPPVLFTADQLRAPKQCASNGSSNGASQMRASTASSSNSLAGSGSSSSSSNDSSSLERSRSIEGPATPSQRSRTELGRASSISSISSDSEASSSGRSESSTADDNSCSPAAPAHPAAAAPTAPAVPAAAGAAPWPPDVPWGLGVVVQVMGLWMLAYLAVGRVVVPALLLLLHIDQAALSPRATALLNLALDSGQVVVTLALLAVSLGRYKPRQRGMFPFAWRGGAWLPWLAAGAAVFPLIDWLAFTSVRLLSGTEDAGLDVWSSQVEAGIAYDRDWLTGGAYLLVVGLCAPLWEEAIFRGFLLASLAKQLPPGPAVAASSLIFALCHSRSETFAPLLLLGLVIGGLYMTCANLLPPMLLHGLWNSYVLGTLALRMRCGMTPVAASAVMALGIQAALLAATAAATAWRHWSSSRSNSSSSSSASDDSGSISSDALSGGGGGGGGSSSSISTGAAA